MANLTLVPSPAEVERVEADVLKRAIKDMTEPDPSGEAGARRKVLGESVPPRRAPSPRSFKRWGGQKVWSEDRSCQGSVDVPPG